MQLSEVFITLHTYNPHPLYSSPISRFHFTYLHFYSMFASPLYYCYNILDGFYPLFFFRLDYVSFFTAPFRISFSLSQCLPLSTFPYSAFLLLMHITCLFSSSNHITSSYLCYFQNIFSSPPYLMKGQARNIVLLKFFL